MTKTLRVTAEYEVKVSDDINEETIENILERESVPHAVELIGQVSRADPEKITFEIES